MSDIVESKQQAEINEETENMISEIQDVFTNAGVVVTALPYRCENMESEYNHKIETLNKYLESKLEKERRAIFVDTTELFYKNNQIKMNMYDEKQENLSEKGLENIAEKWKNIIENSENMFQRKNKQPM